MEEPLHDHCIQTVNLHDYNTVLTAVTHADVVLRINTAHSNELIMVDMLYDFTDDHPVCDCLVLYGAMHVCGHSGMKAAGTGQPYRLEIEDVCL